MRLQPGTILSHYRLDRKIGEGGMGEVWRGIDTTLDRPVAIKILPEAFSEDADRLARFDREAKLLASLHHPGIAVIHGLHLEGKVHFLSMELVEGEDLAKRLKAGPVPVEEAISLAVQIAEALEAAHERGVIHRDLKPANIQVTCEGKAKILDFGLAKAFEPESGSGSPSLSPTMTAGATRAGMILGTAAYMSPEQARGRAVDKRADIWAFGCVLYEMLSGKLAFGGETVSDTLAEVLKSEPKWTGFPPATPSRVVNLLKRCLVKDPKQRLRDMGDARLELTQATADEPGAIEEGKALPRRGLSWIGLGVGLLAGAAVMLVGLRLFSSSAPQPEVRRYSIQAPQLAYGFERAAKISPDGRFIVYSSRDRLWIRDLRRFEAAEIPGSEKAIGPFWSPESDHVGFERDRKIWTWALAGGQSTSISPVPGPKGFNGAVWGRDGEIYFATFRGGLYEVAAVGGDPRLVASPDSSEVDFHYPDLLPDGRHLVTVAHRKEGGYPIVLLTLPGGERKNLKSFEQLTNVVYSVTGHLLMTMSIPQRILAVGFSEATREITGDPFLVADGGEFPSVSHTGTLIYTLGWTYAQRELQWVDHDGRPGGIVGEAQPGLDFPAISPDGRRVAVTAFEKGNGDIWVNDLTRGSRSRIVSGPENEGGAIWSPSGDKLYYLKIGNVSATLMEVPADGSTPPRALVEGVSPDPFFVSPDGKTLVYVEEKQGFNSLWRLGLSGGGAPVRLSPNPSVDESEPALSPDGRWIAYVSDEAGAGQIFVRRFPEGNGKQQVSLHGGSSALWSRTGKSLLFWEDDALMEVPVQTGATLTFGETRQLFTAADVGIVNWDLSTRYALDVAHDGRFLIVHRSSKDPRAGILVVENWFDEFRTR